MQTFQILIDNRFSASTTPTQSATTNSLDFFDGYYAYETKIGGGIVDFSNVRGYLNDSKNQQITNDFFQYLTGSTTPSKALNIINSDEKLAVIFNDYYQRVVLSGSNIVNTVLINQNLTGSTNVIAKTYNHPWAGFAPSKQLTGITLDIYGSPNSVQQSTLWQEFTTDESYYVPVYIQRSNNQLARYHYEVCDVVLNAKTAGLYPEFSAYTQTIVDNRNTYEFNVFVNNFIGSLILAFGGALPAGFSFLSITGTSVNTILDCFVDINLQTNENIYWNNATF